MGSRDDLLKQFPELARALTTYDAVRPDHVPYDMVKKNYTLPFDGYEFQVDSINDLAWRPRTGLYLDTGTGKTFVSTMIALYKLLNGIDKVIVLLPPILITGWMRWLAKIPEVTAVAYRGTPKARAAIKFDATFVAMSYQIFKRDVERITAETAGQRVLVIADEATAIKNAASDNHRLIYDFAVGQDIALLTGTPLSKPDDAYAYCKFIAPGTYRSMGHFNQIHINEVDFFGNVVSYRNLDILAENMKINAVRVLKEDVLKDLPPITYTPLYYDLALDHERLYNKLADEQILKLESGGKIDATSVQALHHALGQIISNYGHFAGDETKVSTAIDLLEETIEELAGKKLLVFTNYQMTNRFLEERLKPFNARVIFGGTKESDRQKHLDTFVNDPSCRCLVLQTVAGGFGIDGLQEVSSDVLFLEIPPVPAWFHQAGARLHRAGQRNNVNVRVAVAQRTCNVRQFSNLMAKDALVNKVVRNVGDLRDMVRGN